MKHALARTQPFTGNVLDGFTPSVPHIRYPVTIGLYEEGSNLGLFLAPVDLGLIQLITQDLEQEQALILPGSAVLDDAFMAAPEPKRLIPWSDIHKQSGDIDIIHLPKKLNIEPERIEIPTPVLAAPEHAVPTHLGSRLAIGFSDRCHAAFISPDPALIKRILSGFIEAYVSAATGQDAVPEMQHPDLVPLQTVMAPGEWKELRFVQRKRYWMLEATSSGSSLPEHRWVTEGPTGHWRKGWSW